MLNVQDCVSCMNNHWVMSSDFSDNLMTLRVGGTPPKILEATIGMTVKFLPDIVSIRTYKKSRDILI